jgi:hypothetical protein
MKRLLITALIAASAVFAQDSQFGGLYRAMAYAYGAQGGPQPLQVSAGNSTLGSSTITLTYGSITLNDGTPFMPLATNAPIVVGAGSNAETVTPTAVSCGTPRVVNSCQVTANFANIHYMGESVSSATIGLQEALNAAHLRGGAAVADGAWAAAGGTTAMISAAVTFSNAVVNDMRNGTGVALPFNTPSGVPQLDGSGHVGLTQTSGTIQAFGGAAGSDSTAALSSLSSVAANTTVVFHAGSYLLNANLTLPSTVGLSFDNGANISVGTGFTLTVQGPVSAPASQIFSGAGTAVLVNQYQIDPHWWGAKIDNSTDDSAAINAAIAGSPLGATVQINGLAKISSPISILQSKRLVCATNSLAISGINGTNAAADLIDVNPENGGVVEIHCDLGGTSYDAVHFLFGATSKYIDRHSSFSGYWTGYTHIGLESSDGSVWENTFNGPLDIRGGTGAQYGVYIKGDQSVAAIRFVNLHVVGNSIAALYVEQSNQTAEMDNVVVEGFKPEVNSGTGLTLRGGVQMTLYDAHFEQNGNNSAGTPDVDISGGSGSVSYLNMYGGLFGVTGASQGNTRIKVTGSLVKMNFLNTNFYRSGTDAIDGQTYFPSLYIAGFGGRPNVLGSVTTAGQGYSDAVNTSNAATYTVGQYEDIILCPPTSTNPVTVTLPTIAGSPFRRIGVAKNGSYRTCNVTTSDGSTVGGKTTDTLNEPWQSRYYINDGGTNWYIAPNEALGALLRAEGAILASGTTITPTNQIHHVSGTSTITTITTPATVITGESLFLVADGLWAISTAGNVAASVNPAVGQAIHLIWSGTKWYPVKSGATGRFAASLTPAAVAANTCTEQTFTVTGIAASDIVSVNKPTSQAGLGVAGARASATNTVGINYCNNTAASITPTAETYSFGVIHCELRHGSNRKRILYLYRSKLTPFP